MIESGTLKGMVFGFVMGFVSFLGDRTILDSWVQNEKSARILRYSFNSYLLMPVYLYVRGLMRGVDQQTELKTRLDVAAFIQSLATFGFGLMMGYATDSFMNRDED